MNILGGHQNEFLRQVIHKAGLADDSSSSLLSLNADDIHAEDLHDWLGKLTISEDSPVFIWGDTNLGQSSLSAIEKAYNEVHDNNVYYIRTGSIIRFVEDVRLTINNKRSEADAVDQKDVCIVYNSLDASPVEGVCSLLDEVVDFTTIKYDQESDNNLLNELQDAAERVKLMVLLFYTQDDWANTLLPEMWKLIGGGSAKSKILIICPDSVDIVYDSQNLAQVFYEKAPQEMIPLEIKMKLDSI